MPITAEEFEQLVETHAAMMSRAIRRVCAVRGRSLIPDIEQEVRLALWKRLSGGKGIEYPVSYFYKVALTTAAAVLRKQSGPGGQVELEALETRGSSPPRERFRPEERRLLLGQVLDRLAPDQRRALRAYLAGFNHKEIARLYSWTESTARHRIYRGLDALRQNQEEAADA